MSIIIKKRLDTLLSQLASGKSFDVAEEITKEICGLLGITTNERFLANISRVDAEISRFQLAPGFARQAAAYELKHDNTKPFDLKLFWLKNTTKTNLLWSIGLTPNFEDAQSNDTKNIGIDFAVPESCDSIMILLSNRLKVRVLELKDHITPTQLEILSSWKSIGQLEIVDKTILHAKLWESFNFEPVNRRFYLELVEHFSVLVQHLEKQFDHKPSVMFTTRLLGRLLFIWFLQKKNLVNKSAGYFKVSGPTGQTEYYKKNLEILFFEVLNREVLERSNGDTITPYLNGGLFDTSSTDFYKDPKLTFPDGYFTQLFETLNKYNFTVDESSPEFQQVAIDPEMLGQIFESLLAEQIDEITGKSEKKAKGTFYTPREIVAYMCEESLVQYLKTKISDTPDRDRRLEELVRMPESIFRDQDQNKRRDWKPYRESILNSLYDPKTKSALTVLDPAVGSGAFPMGMLHLLIKVYSRLDPKYERDIAGLKRTILSRSLYGVDVEQTAIEITRLRAWLSIAVDLPDGEPIEPLPNLEFKFVCANTLIALDTNKQSALTSNPELKQRLIDIRDEYYRTSSKAKKEKLQTNYLKLTNENSLFDDKATQQLKNYKPFDVSSSSEFYDPALMHGVEAFDVVIGNPPYISSWKDKEGSPQKNYYKKNYITVVGHYDIYVLFYEKGINLLKNNGTLSYITSNKWMAQSYGLELRKLFLRKRILKIVDFKGYKVFDSATVDTQITILKNEDVSSDYSLDVFTLTNNKLPDFSTLKYVSLDTGIFKNTQQLNFKIELNESFISVIDKMRSASIKVEDICYVSVGAICHSDKPVKLPKNHFIFETQNKDDTLKPYIEGKDIQKWRITNHKFLDYQPKLFNQGAGFPELFCAKKIVNKRTCGRRTLEFVLDTNGYYTNEKVNNVVLYHELENVRNRQLSGNISNMKVELSRNYSYKFILGVLNSKVTNWYFKTLMANGLDFYPSQLRSMLIPTITDTKKDQDLVKRIEILVDHILEIKTNNLDANTTTQEHQIDDYVYKHYDLTPEEIEIVNDMK